MDYSDVQEFQCPGTSEAGFLTSSDCDFFEKSSPFLDSDSTQSFKATMQLEGGIENLEKFEGAYNWDICVGVKEPMKELWVL